MSESDEMKIQVDSDWKAEARKEKERLAAQSKPKAEPAPEAGAAGQGDAQPQSQRRQLPEASFETLVSTMTTQALFALGGIPDPQTGRPSVQVDLARHHIDMLGVLEEKCKGNLSDEETNLLAQTLYELRGRYVQVVNAMAQPV